MKLTNENLKKYYAYKNIYLKENKISELKEELIKFTLSYIVQNFNTINKNDFNGPSLFTLDYINIKALDYLNFVVQEKYIKTKVRCLDKAKEEYIKFLFQEIFSVGKLKYKIYYKEFSIDDFLYIDEDFLNEFKKCKNEFRLKIKEGIHSLKAHKVSGIITKEVYLSFYTQSYIKDKVNQITNQINISLRMELNKLNKLKKIDLSQEIIKRHLSYSSSLKSPL